MITVITTRLPTAPPTAPPTEPLMTSGDDVTVVACGLAVGEPVDIMHSLYNGKKGSYHVVVVA